MHSHSAAMAFLQPGNCFHSIVDHPDVPSKPHVSRDATPPPSPFFPSLVRPDPAAEFDFPEPGSPLSPRTLYAQSFDRPASARSLPSGRFRKNMKDITGFGTTEEEFEALPIAVRRKYFSTLERLRFAQNSRSHALNELPIQRNRKSSLADRRGVNLPLIEARRSTSNSRRLRKLVRQQSVSSDEASWFLTLPDQIKNKQFTREEQVVLAAQLRDSVILDAADEAIIKASRRTSRIVNPSYDPLTPSTLRSSIGSREETTDSSLQQMESTIYESFRWMDEEEDLDLKLVLDDYHANLDGAVVDTPSSNRRPSFRRQMSISKMPFGGGRNSLSSLQLQPRSPRFEAPSHSRQKSRAMSLISPKHTSHDSITSIDPNATHYQDPEARLKLRVYLASAQKFDEVIEFGFPSMDAMTDGADKENKPPKRLPRNLTRMNKTLDSEQGKSFLDDDSVSLFADDVSMAEPESPLTPLGGETDVRGQVRLLNTSASKGSKRSSDFSRIGHAKPAKHPDGYSHASAGSREMTLRMTLTRPDLRADEGLVYGWQASKSPLGEAPGSRDNIEKYAVKGPLGGADGWGSEKENGNGSGVVKRFWKRVKSSQRKGL